MLLNRPEGVRIQDGLGFLSIQPAAGGGADITEDFVSISEWNGTTGVADLTGGDLSFTGEGFILHSTSLGTGDKWMRFKVISPVVEASARLFFALGDASGNLKGWAIAVDTGACRIPHATEYNTYSTWVGDTSIALNGGTLSSGDFIGVTFEASANRIRVWSPVTAAEPDSVSSWDSGAADITDTTMTFEANSVAIGFGCFSGSGTAGDSVDDLTAGAF